MKAVKNLLKNEDANTNDAKGPVIAWDGGTPPPPDEPPKG
jgi:hypothetical protein